MHVVPQSRTARLVICGVIAVLAVAGVIFRDQLAFGYKQLFPDDAITAAEDGSSDEADLGGDRRLPTASEAPGATGSDPSIDLDLIVTLDSPSSVADPGGPGSVLVSTLGGQIHAVDLDAGTDEVVFDLSDQVSTGGERGLLSIAIDPDGSRLYADYTNGDGDTEIRSWDLVDGRPQGDPDEGVLHLEIGQPFANHNGGNLVFGPDELLWIGTGDGGGAGDPGDVAQDPSKLLGKMLRVTPDPSGGVTAPSTNPDWDGRREIWGIGLRNPWRYSFDRATGELWVADVGQQTIEEVTVVDPDRAMPDFGWNTVEGNNRYKGSVDPSFAAPAVEYDHSEGCSITGGFVYRGEVIESLYGWYLFSDFCGGYIRAVPADDPGSKPVELIADAGGGLSFGELEDGELVFLTREGLSRIVAG